jgi:hypothetical protein
MTMKIKNGVLPFACSVTLDSDSATVVSTDIENTDAGVLDCRGQLAYFTIEASLAAGTDALSDFLIEVQAHEDGDWHANQDTAGDAIETTAAAGSNALTINLGSPWKVRFKATKAADNTDQVLTVRGTANIWSKTD